MPELMVTIFNLREESLSVRILKRLEKWSIAFADRVVTVNEASRRIFCSRGCPPGKLGVIMNSPDEDIFGFKEISTPRPVGGIVPQPFIIMYHGSLVERNGVDVAFRAFEIAKGSIPTAELHIYGEPNAFLESVMDAVRHRGLNESVRAMGRRSVEGIAEAIESCDVGVIPNRRSAFTEMNTPTRIFEYLARGKPVIAPRTRGILDYFGGDDLIFFETGDEQDLARKIEFVHAHPEQVGGILRRGQTVYSKHRWNRQREDFINLVEHLIHPNRGSRRAGNVESPVPQETLVGK
jgi:glycosyltransferase involved in cell wall biosynthesis